MALSSGVQLLCGLRSVTAFSEPQFTHKAHSVSVVSQNGGPWHRVCRTHGGPLWASFLMMETRLDSNFFPWGPQTTLHLPRASVCSPVKWVGCSTSKEYVETSTFPSFPCPTALSTSQGCPSPTPAPLGGSGVAAMARSLGLSTLAGNRCQPSCLPTLQGLTGTSFGVSTDMPPNPSFRTPCWPMTHLRSKKAKKSQVLIVCPSPVQLWS